MSRQTYLQLKHGTVIQTDMPEAWPGAQKITAAEGRRLLEQEAREHLKQWLPHGSTVYAIVRSVSRSGMSRDISLYAIVSGRMVSVTGYAARVTGSRPVETDGRHAIRVKGCGMDMVADLVSRLAWTLYGDDQAFRSEIL